MQRPCLLVLICLIAVIAGCRSDPHTDLYFDVLNTEKRVLEDRLYRLEYENEVLKKKLESMEANKESSEKQTSAASEPEEEPAGIPDDLPDIELPPGFEDETEGEATSFLMRPASTATAGSSMFPEDDRRVESIRINTRVTGGLDLDGRPGDDGFRVLIEPRDEQGHFVLKSRPVSLVLLDPNKQGEAARVGRWDFDAVAARKALQSDTLDRGLLFRVPWEGCQPDHDQLQLFVRWIGEDGEQIEANCPLKIQLVDRVAQHWMPRTGSREAEPSAPQITRRDQSPMGSGQVRTATHLAPVAPDSMRPPAQDGRPQFAPPPDPHATIGSFWSPNR